MGYLYREDNNPQMAEQYFNRLAAAYPDDYVPYLALGDLYMQIKQFDKADTSLREGLQAGAAESGGHRQCGQRGHREPADQAGGPVGESCPGQDGRRSARDARARALAASTRASTASRRSWATRCCRSCPRIATPRSISPTTCTTWAATTRRWRVANKYQARAAQRAQLPAAGRSRSQAVAAAVRVGERLHATPSSAIPRWWKRTSTAAMC